LRRRLREPIHRLQYALNAYGPAPAGRVGIQRVWTEQQISAIQESLRKTAENRNVAEAVQ
jgi:hypothetical protein